MARPTARIAILLLFGALFFGSASARAADFPDRPVRFILGFAPGGGVDALTRLIARNLAEKWGQQVIVENHPGGDATIAQNLVAHAAPDGYTIIMANNNLVNTTGKYDVTYDPIRSFAPVTLVAYVPLVLLTNPSYVSVNSIPDLVALAKSKPGQLNFGSSGPSSPPFSAMQAFMTLTGINMVNVTYNGDAPTVVGLLGGEVQTMFGSVSGSVGLVKAGRLKALAVTGNVHVPALPDVPDFGEMAGMQGIESAWNGVLVPAGTPPEVVAKLHDDIVAVLQMPETQKILSDQGFVAAGSTPEQYTETLVRGIAEQASGKAGNAK